ncbi:hypothetical protein B4N89_41845 [Embleya scabrispora]|uniref:Lipoprotein n=1 Tax=Embleya scabrispora TaxID=159449 RepID=A0A1T3NK85_9ACTN|nr:hypothetical protein B4N89_41845 [Embleya scabrispora]
MASVAGLLLLAGCGDDAKDDKKTVPAGDTAAPLPGASSTDTGKNSGSDEGDNSKLDDAALRTKVQASAGATKTVHTVGTVRGQKGETRLDLHVDNVTKNYAGTLTASGRVVEVMRLGPDMYLKAGADFWTKDAKVNDPNVVALLQDKHVKLKADDPRFKNITAIAELGDIKSAVSDWGPTVQRRPEAEVNGKRMIVFADNDPQDGETLLYIPAKGDPAPVRLENKNPTDGGTIDWSEHNKPVTVTAPGPETTVNLPALTGETPAAG